MKQKIMMTLLCCCAGVLFWLVQRESLRQNHVQPVDSKGGVVNDIDFKPGSQQSPTTTALQSDRPMAGEAGERNKSRELVDDARIPESQADQPENAEPVMKQQQGGIPGQSLLKSSQDIRGLTAMNALPKSHLQSLIANAAEAEILEENGQPGSTATRVVGATESERPELGATLLATFQNEPSDDKKIDLLALAAQLQWTPSTRYMIELALAPAQSEEVRVQAVYIARDLSPYLLRSLVRDPNEAVRYEAIAQLRAVGQ